MPRTAGSWAHWENCSDGGLRLFLTHPARYVSTSLSLTEPGLGAPGPQHPSAGRRSLLRHWWPWVVLGVAVVSALFVVVSDMRPSYDGFGFMVWGRQVLHWNLNTDGAPSWKPLPFLFTLPYAVAGRGQMWLWMG